MKTADVRVFGIQVNEGTKSATGKERGKAKKSYTVRWQVGRERTSRTFSTRALADNHRSNLVQAMNNGEAFDTETFLPESMKEAKAARSVLAFAQAYVSMKWPRAAAKSRDSMTDALATILPALVTDRPGRPDVKVLREGLRKYVLPPAGRELEQPRDIASALRWLEKASMPLPEMKETKHVRTGLDALALTLDGTAASAETIRRKRSVFYNLLEYGVELEEFESNPIDRVAWTRPKVSNSVDRRVVVNPRQARELLTALTYVGGRRNRGARMRAMFACMYFGALRPAEAVGLRQSNCHLPARCGSCGADLTTAPPASRDCAHEQVVCGWGLLTLEKSRPQAGKQWTDSGEAHDDRGLKHRAKDETREVPIPPELVAILREHITTFGVADDGRLFRSERGNVVSGSNYYRVWQLARPLALRPDQVDSPLAARPYDLRHAAVSLWLNAGVPATEVAERAGHTVDVLLKVYAKCIDGQRDVINKRIEDALDDAA
jgi:integrase